MVKALRFIAGFVLGGLAAAVAGFSLPALVPISQAEGAYAMAVAFFWAPLGAVLGGIAALVWPRRRR